MKHIESKYKSIGKRTLEEAWGLCLQYDLTPYELIPSHNNDVVIRDKDSNMIATVSKRFGKKALISIDVCIN